SSREVPPFELHPTRAARAAPAIGLIRRWENLRFFIGTRFPRGARSISCPAGVFFGPTSYIEGFLARPGGTAGEPTPAVREGRADQMPLSYEDLFQPFHGAMKPPSAWRIGAEAEKFGVSLSGGATLPYEGDNGVVGILRELSRRFKWKPISEKTDGPLIALE